MKTIRNKAQKSDEDDVLVYFLDAIADGNTYLVINRLRTFSLINLRQKFITEEGT